MTAHYKKNRGQDLVEYALMVPIMLMCLLMIVDLGRVTYAYSVIFNAVREGARYGSVHFQDESTRTAEVKTYINSRVPGITINSDDVIVNWVVLDVIGEPDRLTVALSYDFDPITPFIEGLLGGGDLFTIGSQATMNLEY